MPGGGANSPGGQLAQNALSATIDAKIAIIVCNGAVACGGRGRARDGREEMRVPENLQQKQVKRDAAGHRRESTGDLRGCRFPAENSENSGAREAGTAIEMPDGCKSLAEAAKAGL